MIRNLRTLANEKNLVFGVKLSNTLEVENFRQVFDRDERMYMSGRALHAVTVNLAYTLMQEFNGELLISFAGGADCFNVPDLLASGMVTVTVCSDLLKSGGYMRMLQYFETLEASMDEVGAQTLRELICKSATHQAGAEETAVVLGESSTDLDAATIRGLSSGAVTGLARLNLARYAAQTRSEWSLRKDSFRTDRSKTSRKLGLFDCIEAPCVDECPVDQKVPQYMNAVRQRDFAKAVSLTREDNPLPTILGRVCDHLCENTCIRAHYDEPLAIRDIKRFIMAQEAQPTLFAQESPVGRKVAILGAGPAGLAAAQELAYAGFGVCVFEMYPYAGGMVGGAIPTYRLPQSEIDQDVRVLEKLGVEIRYEMKAGVDFTLGDLRSEGFEFIFVAVGAQLAKQLDLPGEDSAGVMDALQFLRSVREGNPVSIGNRVGVIGAGDTAMDCVRSAYRLGSEVTLIYRRTIDQMPADREEIRGAIEEGIRIVELVKPIELIVEEGRLTGLICKQMEYRGDRDVSGRKIPHGVEGNKTKIPLDTLILAISQHSLLDFFAGQMPELNDRGYIIVHPQTLETSVPGVYAGGDVAADGPSSIVKAAADGKKVAASILARAARSVAAPVAAGEEFDLADLLVRRAHRQWRVPLTHTPLAERMSFDETILTYTAEEAIAEAGRCLDCHQICSLCVGVCPNMALMTYAAEPFIRFLPSLKAVDGQIEVGESHEFRGDQKYQIAVLTDFCNECGNCTTFCPTAGEPYRDKPRLYLYRPDFEAESDNAFMMTRNGDTIAIEARWEGETHRLEVGSEIRYQSPSIDARVDPGNFSLIEATPGETAIEGQVVTLEVCATMYVVLLGITASMPQIPWAEPTAPQAPGTRIAHPGNEE